MRLGRKLLAIAGLMLLLLLPLALLDGLVYERQQRAEEVKLDIAQASARPQRMVAPLLRVEIETVSRRMQTVGKGDSERLEPVETTHQEVRLLAAEAVAVDTALATEVRRRGLFEAQIYQVKGSATARFRLPAAETAADQVSWRIRSAHWVWGLSDNRGIAALAVKANGEVLSPEPGTGVTWLPEGVQARVPGALETGAMIDTQAEFTLLGTEHLSWLPVATDFEWKARADWPHPRFTGFALPVGHDVSAKGFTAQWRLSALASQAPQRLLRCPPAADGCADLEATAVQIDLIHPVDRYLMTDRAIKYALLFLGLVFGAVFLMEVLRGAAVHPLHYLLVGLALALFFLLLLALAEHLPFALAYGIAAVACVGLIGFYLAGVLGGWRRGVGLAGLLALLYAALYGLLQSEDHALLLGAVLLFGVLAATMALTRRIDWGRLQ